MVMIRKPLRMLEHLLGRIDAKFEFVFDFELVLSLDCLIEYAPLSRLVLISYLNFVRKLEEVDF